MVDVEGTDSAKDILRAEIARKDISTQQLTDLLIARGIDVTRAAVVNRISRGTFTADFFVDCLRAIGSQRVAVIDGISEEASRK